MLETGRLLMRPFDVADVDEAFEWFGDPAVMRFTATGPDASPAHTRARIDGYRAHQARHGFSKWLIVERRSGQRIGDAGPMSLPEFGVELGFRLARPWWGRGLATEAAAAWVRAAFEEHGLSRLAAFSHPENAAAHHVLAKLSFRPRGRGVVLGMDSLLFELPAPELARSMSG